MKNSLESYLMQKGYVISSLFICLATLSGCVTYQQPPAEAAAYGAECANGICTSNQEYTAVCTENADGYSECHDGAPVSYTRTAADFREYGERTPRDHRITQAAAGNNISATVMPSINDEVVEYEAEVSGNPQTTPAQVQQFEAIDNEPAEEYADDPNRDWLAEEGQSLKDLLVQWSDEAGWRLIWKTNRNYTLNAGAMFRGNFADVASALVRAFARAKPAPIATFYKGNRVLVIQTMEDENAYD